ncbi:MAG: alpha-ketoacid dehydrogenase subunit beta [candidate division NC10 bacterium]|nr:alpha-ketoacid dehydrogenase subunit beta [candidate division NC10 bacterium]
MAELRRGREPHWDLVICHWSLEGVPVREITYKQAIQEALREEMRRDERVFLMGEDIGVYGGAFGVTLGFLEEFGKDRVRDTPISELGIVGAAAGAALLGMRPVVEIMFMDFTTLALDQLANQAAKMRFMFGGKARVPMVLRAPQGAGTGAAAQHSQSLEALFVHFPGLKVAMPSTPADAKGLLKAAIRDDNPVVFIEHKLLYNRKGPVPEGEHVVPLGQADVKRPGRDLTIIAVLGMVPKALAAAETLAGEGIEAEVVDPRSLPPLDEGTILDSARRTGRVLITHEACRTGGVGAEILARIVEGAFDYLDAPVCRLAGRDLPIPYSKELERQVIPQEEDIVREARRLVRGRAHGA